MQYQESANSMQGFKNSATTLTILESPESPVLQTPNCSCINRIALVSNFQQYQESQGNPNCNLKPCLRANPFLLSYTNPLISYIRQASHITPTPPSLYIGKHVSCDIHTPTKN